MTGLLPAMPELPGTDPRFHEARKYLSPVKHKGEEILGAYGSCKEDDCSFRGAWASQPARDRSMWMHRALKVREARMTYFLELFPKPLSPQPARLLRETADNNSHFYSPWKNQVENFFRELIGEPREVGEEFKLPEYPYYQDYLAGKTAVDTAAFLFEAGLRY